MTLVGEPVTRPDPRTFQATYRCDNCGTLCIGSTSWRADQAGGSLKSYMQLETTDIRWLPARGAVKDYPDVPAHIASAAGEAHACRSILANRAAVLMARSVIEATAKDKGITKGTLEAKIDKMHDDGLVRELVKEQAHEIRHLGNDMAHGDFVEPVTEEEADEILELMAEVLAEVYQAPARLEARRLARLAKTQPTA